MSRYWEIGGAGSSNLSIFLSQVSAVKKEESPFHDLNSSMSPLYVSSHQSANSSGDNRALCVLGYGNHSKGSGNSLSVKSICLLHQSGNDTAPSSLTVSGICIPKMHGAEHAKNNRYKNIFLFDAVNKNML